MSLQDSLFTEEVENDVTLFAGGKSTKRVLVFPPVNNYRRYLIHQIVQDHFGEQLATFSIGQGYDRRTVVCWKCDVIRDPKLNGRTSTVVGDTSSRMGAEDRRSPSASPDNNRQRQVKSTPAAQIYRPPAARRAQNGTSSVNTTGEAATTAKMQRQRRPDRAVYVPKHRRSAEVEGSPQPAEEILARKSKSDRSTRKSKSEVIEPAAEMPRKTPDIPISVELRNESGNKSEELRIKSDESPNKTAEFPRKSEQFQIKNQEFYDQNKDSPKNSEEIPNKKEFSEVFTEEKCEKMKKSESPIKITVISENKNVSIVQAKPEVIDNDNDIIKTPVKMAHVNKNDEVINEKKVEPVSEVLVISSSESSSPAKKIVHEEVPAVRPPEKKPKKVARAKSKPASPPSPPIKLNRDECDWDSLFDDNGECLDPTLIEELSAAVGEVQIEQPKNDYKPYTRPVEVSNDEYAHVIEIYNFPSEFKTSDLAAVFSPFKNGGFELKWVDDTHCLGVFSSPLVAAEVLASDHPFVKTRPLSEATQMSRAKARKSAEFLQPYRSRPETCAALARRLVTGALGVRLATARQEREHEKIVLREAKERRRLARKQSEDVWEGIITPK